MVNNIKDVLILYVLLITIVGLGALKEDVSRASEADEDKQSRGNNRHLHLACYLLLAPPISVCWLAQFLCDATKISTIRYILNKDP